MELATLLDEIVGKHKVDQDRIYVTGLSMGGFGTWSLAAYQPNRFAAIARFAAAVKSIGLTLLPMFLSGHFTVPKTSESHPNGRNRWSRP